MQAFAQKQPAPAHPVPSAETGHNTDWMPSLAGKTAFSNSVVPLFGADSKRKLASTPSAHNTYITFTPDNTPCPLATWRAIVNSEAMEYHSDNAQVLSEFIKGTGKYYQDYDWIKYNKDVGKVPYTVFDTETTGLNQNDRIIQLAAVSVNANHTVNHEMDYNTYINPGTDEQGNPFQIAPEASDVHGITAEMVKDKPTMEKILEDICNNRLKKTGLVVAYNAKFDIHYMNNAIDKWNRSSMRREFGQLRALQNALVLDPYILIQRIHPFVSLRKRLGDHYEILMGRPLENKHDALADVEATIDVLKYVFKYLEKHTIPREWAEYADQNLTQKNLKPAEKAGIIARFVRENRKQLEAMMPVQPEPLKMTDVLKFQHGAPVYYDDSGLPKLDISLNIFGWDGTKVWADKTDVLDAEVVQQIREDRDKENRLFIIDKLHAGKTVSPAKAQLGEALQGILKPKATGNQINVERMRLSLDLLHEVGQGFADRLLTQKLPRNEKGWESYRKEIAKNLQSALDKKLSEEDKAPANLSKQAQEAVEPLSHELIARMQEIQKELENRFLYTLVPVDPKKPLIDPMALMMDTTRKPRRGVIR